MKMTRLEWRYLQKVALDHPYFDTHKLPLTEKEARAIVEENIQMTGKEFVDSIYANLGMTRPKEKKECFAWLRSISEMVTIPPIRKIAIAVLVVVLMTVFFTATPTGRAIAESMIQYFATLFEDGRVGYKLNGNGMMMNPVYTVPDSGKEEILEQEFNDVYVNSFEEFTAATGVKPTVLPFPLSALYYDYDEYIDYLNLHAEYETPKGTIITYQIWTTEALESSTSTGFSAYDADPSIYYSFDDNGTLSVIKLYENSIFGIIGNGNYTVDELTSFLSFE